MLEHVHLIALFPLAAAFLILFFGRRLPQEGAFLGIAAIGLGLIHSIALLGGIFSGSVVLPDAGPAGACFQRSWEWFRSGPFTFELGVLVDGMSVLLLFVVTLVSTLVQVYSLSYQRGKPRLGRYYAYLSLFTSAMLMLVLANNFLQFFIGWELMGVSSYLLIGFEFEREAAAYAGRKAFITTRIGDVGFYLGLLLLFTQLKTYNFVELHKLAPTLALGTATAAALLLFCGSVGKSAQVPLHVWLPDAMEGPTPVSALIHAATMVAAGVYLVARFFFVFALSPTALQVVAWTGGATALIAALSALTASDIKKVLAYSTISQLGYMMMAMGAGNPQAGMFHLTTHAFFKALLFLGAGSVIHAVHTNEMGKMGGLSKKMPSTAVTFALATGAIIGVPFLSGFYSKEEILGALLTSGHGGLFVVAVLTAFLTTFYMCRLYILTFLGTPRDPQRFGHAHESPSLITIPLWALGALSVVGGFVLAKGLPIHHLIPGPEAVENAHVHHLVLGSSLTALAGGIALAYSMYVRGVPDPGKLALKFPGVYAFLNRRYADEFYLHLVEWFGWKPGRVLAALDYHVLDQGLVDGVGRVGRVLAVAGRWLDDVVVDGVLVNGTGVVSQFVGAQVRRLQNGSVQRYLLALAFGLSVLALWALQALG
jgi:NADH-quinone oxidoreductase subunit L